MLSEVVLQGAMGRRFGRSFTLDVQSPAEAIRALMSMVPGFREWLVERQEKGFRVWMGEAGPKVDSLTKDELGLCSAGKRITIGMVVRGGKTPLGQVIVGVVLVVIGTVISYYGAPQVGGAIAAYGWGMIVGGVARALFAPPDPSQPNEKDKNRPSYNFGGPVNTQLQGQPVPVGYGRLRVGGAVISAGIRQEFPASTGPTGPGGFGGGGCPVPETPTCGGRTIGDLRVGDAVRTQHEDDLTFGDYEVEAAERMLAHCLRVVTSDGRELVASFNHRVLVVDTIHGFRRWCEIQHLALGDLLDGEQPGEVALIEEVGEREVVKLTVKGAHTVQTAGLTSHNIKNPFNGVDGGWSDHGDTYDLSKFSPSY